MNEKASSSSHSRGRLFIGGWVGLALLCLHLTHFESIFRNPPRNPMIKSSCLRMFLTYSGLCLGCHHVLSPEVLRLDVSHFIILDASRCYRGWNDSVNLSIALFLLPGRVTIWQYSRFLRLPCWLLTSKHSGSFQLEQIFLFVSDFVRFAMSLFWSRQRYAVITCKMTSLMKLSLNYMKKEIADLKKLRHHIVVTKIWTTK